MESHGIPWSTMDSIPAHEAPSHHIVPYVDTAAFVESVVASSSVQLRQNGSEARSSSKEAPSSCKETPSSSKETPSCCRAASSSTSTSASSESSTRSLREVCSSALATLGLSLDMSGLRLGAPDRIGDPIQPRDSPWAPWALGASVKYACCARVYLPRSACCARVSDVPGG